MLAFQSAGELLVRGFQLPFPGPVLGMVLLVPALQWAVVRTPVAVITEFLLKHLSLLFVPVVVGVMMHLALVTQYGLRMLAVVVVSCLLGLLVTVLMLQRLDRPAATPRPEHPVQWPVVLLASGLLIRGVPYPTYFAAAQFIHFLLGPAVVAMAWPLWQRRAELRQRWGRLQGAALAGGQRVGRAAGLLGWWVPWRASTCSMRCASKPTQRAGPHGALRWALQRTAWGGPGAAGQ